MSSQEKIRQIVEALLFVSDKPLSLEVLKEVLEVDKKEIKSAIEELRSEYQSHHSFKLREVAGGYQLVTDSQWSHWLRKLFQKGRSQRLTRPALETLAIIAYKQPITRPEIESIRGVDVDGVIKTLLERGLIKISGRKKVPGRPLLYGTSKRFLEYFGLNSLEELPPLDQLLKMGEEDGDKADSGENRPAG